MTRADEGCARARTARAGICARYRSYVIISEKLVAQAVKYEIT